MVTDLELKESNILESLLILQLTLGKSGLQDLDLLVKQSQLVISSDELSTQSVTLSHELLGLSLTLGNLVVLLRDELLKSEDLLIKLNGQLILLIEQLGEFGLLKIGLVHFSLLDTQGLDLRSQSLLLGLTVSLELSDLVLSDEELILQIMDLISLLNVVLGVQVSFSSNSLVEVLLLLQLLLVLLGFSLQLGNHVGSQLVVLHHLHQTFVGSLSILSRLLGGFLKSVDLSQELLDVLILGSALLIEGIDLAVELNDFESVLLVNLTSLSDVLVHHVSVSDESKDVTLLQISLLSQVLDLSGQGIHTSLSDVFGVFGLILKSLELVPFGHNLVVFELVRVVLFSQVGSLVSKLVPFDDELIQSLPLVVELLALLLVLVLLTLNLDLKGHDLFLALIQLSRGLGELAEQLLHLLVLLVVLLVLLSEVLLNLLLLLGEFHLFLGKELLLSLLLGLILLKHLILMLLSLNKLFLLEQVVLKHHNSLLKGGLGLLEIVDFGILRLDFSVELLRLLDEVVKLVILAKRQTTAVFDDLLQLGDLVSEVGNELSARLLSGLGSLDKLPALLDLLSEHCNGGGVVLSQLDGSLDSHCVLEDGIVEVLASSNEPLFRLVTSPHGSVDLLVFLSELLHAWVTYQFVDDLFEVFLKCLKLGLIKTHLLVLGIHARVSVSHNKFEINYNFPIQIAYIPFE